MNHCNSAYSLTKLSGSSLVKNKQLVWTVRPLIELNYDENSPVCMNRLDDLGVVVTPSVEDVVLNLKNLSTSACVSYSHVIEDLDLLHFNSRLLPEVVVTMLQYILIELLNNSVFSFEEACNQYCHDLSNIEILPVRLHDSGTEQYALAMPTQVLNVTSSSIEIYYPFLHPLIEKAYTVAHFLSNIGVQKTLGFSHIRYILLLAKSRFKENKIDSITQSIVIKATQDLVSLLQHEQSEDNIIQCLQPLYLLNEDGVLTECSKIVVYDISGSHKFPLPSGYAYLHPLGESHFEISKSLLHFLPKKFGLISLKSITRYEILDNEPVQYEFPRVSIVGKILKSNEFTKALILFSNCCTHGTTPQSVADTLTTFQDNLTIHYLDTVCIRPYLLIDENKISINDHDTLNNSFFLDEICGQKWSLYLKNTQGAYLFPVFLQLAKKICSKLKLNDTHYFDATNDDDLPDLATFVGLVLQCNSISSIANIVQQYIPGAQIDIIVSDDAMSNSINIPEEDLFDLLSSEELGGNVDKQMLQKVVKTLMEWNKPEPKINLDEAKIWIQQAEYDYSALCTLKDASKTGEKLHFASVCFMCHQVAEKSLKAGLYAKSGFKVGYLRSHNLSSLANELQMMGVRSIEEKEVAILNEMYLPTRYPNCHSPSAVPGDMFSIGTAEEAFDATTRIFEAMQDMINNIVK